jgi:hypothetical protein
MKLRCFFFGHEWQRLHTDRDGISFIEECERCKYGRYLKFLGYASFTGNFTAKELEEWKKGRPSK